MENDSSDNEEIDTTYDRSCQVEQTSHWSMPENNANDSECEISQRNAYSAHTVHEQNKFRRAKGPSAKPPMGPQRRNYIPQVTSKNHGDVSIDASQDMSLVYAELQEINAKLKDESRILREQQKVMKEREQRLVATEQQLDQIVQAKVQEKIALKEQELLLKIDQLENALHEKTVENKRQAENFYTLKTSNDAIKKKVDVLHGQNEKLEKQNQSLQARLLNLQRKQDFGQKKEVSVQNVAARKEPVQKSREVAEKRPSKLKTALTQEVLSGLLEWLSELHLRKQFFDSSHSTESKPADLHEKCVKTIPPLVELMRDASFNHQRKFVLPCLQFLYWSIMVLDQQFQKSTLTATIRRLGEELFKPHKRSSSQDPLPGLTGSTETVHTADSSSGEAAVFFRSSDVHVRFLSCILILRCISQADHIAQVFEVLRADLKSDTGKELYLYYQATPVLLPHIKPNVKAHTSNAIDIFLQLSMESAQLTAFLESCCTEGWFKAISTVWRGSATDHKTLEKLSILLQKLSKFKSNKKYFEVYGFLSSAQEMIRTLGREHDSAFLSLNLKSILFNYNCNKAAGGSTDF